MHTRIDRPRQGSFFIVGVHIYREADLLLVRQTLRLDGLLFGFGQSWKQQTGENRNDSDYHKQFD
jgi:hypothetical protein